MLSRAAQGGEKTGSGTEIQGTKQRSKRLTHLHSTDFWQRFKDSSMQKEQSPTNGSDRTRYSYAKNLTWTLTSYHIKKRHNLKWITDLIMEPKTIKLLKQNTTEKSLWCWVKQRFLIWHQRHNLEKKKLLITNWTSIKNKNCSLKNTFSEYKDK